MVEWNFWDGNAQRVYTKNPRFRAYVQEKPHKPLVLPQMQFDILNKNTKFRANLQRSTNFHISMSHSKTDLCVFLMGNFEHCPILLQVSCHLIVGPTPNSCHINVKVGRLFWGKN